MERHQPTVSGNTTFNNFTKSVTSADTLFFAAGSTTIIGVATINGIRAVAEDHQPQQLHQLRQRYCRVPHHHHRVGNLDSATKNIRYIDAELGHDVRF